MVKLGLQKCSLEKRHIILALAIHLKVLPKQGQIVPQGSRKTNLFQQPGHSPLELSGQIFFLRVQAIERWGREAKTLAWSIIQAFGNTPSLQFSNSSPKITRQQYTSEMSSGIYIFPPPLLSGRANKKNFFVASLRQRKICSRPREKEHTYMKKLRIYTFYSYLLSIIGDYSLHIRRAIYSAKHNG